MDSVLWNMRDLAQQYVEILSEILGIDVSILDSRQIRIAGSGRMKNRTGSRASSGNIMKYAIESHSTVIVENPVENALCTDCPNREKCDNLCEMWTPIMLSKQAIGVIGCVCYTLQQKSSLLARKKVFRQFFLQFADLLSIQAQMHMEANRDGNIRSMLECVLGLVEIGVLILDEQGNVQNINKVGRELLGLSDKAQKPAKITLKPGDNVKGKEYIVEYNDVRRRIVADIYQIGIAAYDRMLIFGNADSRAEVSDALLGLTPSSDLERIVGKSTAVTQLKRNIVLVAPSMSNVLITGESGTGKELTARAIHGESSRKGGPFIAVNCAALPENLLESELFGYVKGAFTGANSNGKVGLLEAAKGGTFFMDEVGDMPQVVQIKLLRVLEQREVTRLGSNTSIPINVRFVFATNRDLEMMVQEGTFRQDLYYRLNVVPLHLPPLRERTGDIRILAEGFIRKFSAAMKRPYSGIGEDFWNLLESYNWPGNVRELQNVIEYAVNVLPSAGVFHAELLHKRLETETHNLSAPPISKLSWNLADMEKMMIQNCLDTFKGQRDGIRIAAQQLGIGRATLYRKIKEYNLKI